MRVRRIAQHAKRPKTRRLLQVVGIVWKDAVFSDKEEAPKPVDMLTVGFLVGENKDQVSVAHEVDMSDGEFRGVTSVPRGMVTKLTKLGRPISITYDA